MEGKAAATPEDFFAGHPDSLRLFRAVRRAVEEQGPSAMRIGRSQIGFRRRRGFAWIWRPGQYLHGPTAPWC